MGYTTTFDGAFKITPTLKPEDREFLYKLSQTRRIKRNLGPAFGVEGEFYVDGTGFMGQDYDDLNIIDSNSPPSTQPGLWCHWAPNDEGTALAWDETEKFYAYTEWLAYLISNIFIPKDYILDGEVEYQGEDTNDFGKIQIVKNEIRLSEGIKKYKKYRIIS